MNLHPYHRHAALVVLALLLASCTGTSAPARDTYYYTLNYTPPAPAAGAEPLPVVLRVDRFSSAPPFNTQAIIYADNDLYRNAYARHQWIAPPAELLAHLLVRDLQHTGMLQAVLPPDSFNAPTHIVNGWVEEILEMDRPDGWLASLRLSITLLAAREPDPSRRILSQKTYAAAIPVAQRTPAGLAAAMSAAAAQVSAQIVRDIDRQLRRPT